MTSLKNLWQCFICWQSKESDGDKLKDSDVAIALAFGSRRKKASASNDIIARNARRFQRRYGKPLILQELIADCLPQISPVAVIPEHRTREVLSQSKKICDREGWDKVVIIAHPVHQWRAVKMAEKIGFGAVRKVFVESVYDKKAAQWWAKSRFLFKARDLPRRFIYLRRGWI